mgnify:CR=1 FL=1
MNKIIIPDENVMIRTKASQLSVVDLNRQRAAVMERYKIAMATFIGVVENNNFIAARALNSVRFLYRLLIYKITVSRELLGIVLGLFLFLRGLFLIFFYNVHFVRLLLFVELSLLGVFLGLFFSFSGGFGIYSSFVFLLVMVCMGGFGISLVVSVSRFFGHDFWFIKFVF